MRKWVVNWVCRLREVFFFFFTLNGPVNYSLRNVSQSSAVKYGLMCHPGHGWQWLLSRLWVQLSCKCHQRGSVFIDALNLISHSSQRACTLIMFFFPHPPLSLFCGNMKALPLSITYNYTVAQWLDEWKCLAKAPCWNVAPFSINLMATEHVLASGLAEQPVHFAVKLTQWFINTLFHKELCWTFSTSHCI